MEPSRSPSLTPNARRDQRVEAAIPVMVHRGKNAVPLVTSDVSFRGLFVPTNVAPPVRSLVRLRITLGARILDTHAMVVHVKADADERVVGIGLQFWGLAGPDRLVWDTTVNALLAEKRAAEKRASLHPAVTEPVTPSGVRVVTGSKP